jgi:chromosome partitioning protein
MFATQGGLLYLVSMASKSKTPPAPRLTVAVLNHKGGVGKTTLAVNLAAAAHLGGERAIVVDLDTQGSALDWSAERSPGSKLDGLAVARADKALTLPRFREIVAGYDVALLDGPPRLGDITRAAAVAADLVLIPLRPGAFDWWASSETLDLLDSADAVRAELGRDPVRRMFVLNATDVRTRLARSAQEALAKVGELAPVIIAPRIAYAEAATQGEAVLTLPPDGTVKALDAVKDPAAADEVRRLWAALSTTAAEEGSHG